MDPSLSPITKSMFTDMLETQTRLRDEAERKWISARIVIQEIASLVANDWLNEKQTLGVNVDRIPLEVLSGVIRERLSRLSMQNQPVLSAPEQDIRQKFQQLAEDYRLAGLKLDQLEKEKANLTDAVRQMTEHAQKLESKSLDQNTSYRGLDPASLPDFYQDWARDKFFDRQSFALCLMGETGLARAPRLKERIEEKFEMGPRSKGAADVLSDLVERGFADDYATEKGLARRPQGIIELTTLGQIAYLLLTGKKPVVSEYAIKKEHKTDAHTLLNLMAQDWLKKAGYEILEHAPVLQVDAVHVFNPDMIAQRGDEVIYIEVERDSRKGNQDSEAKVRNFCQFTSGRLYFFCESTNAQRSVIREINSSLREMLPKARIAICDLSVIDDDFLRINGDIWTTIRDKAT